MAEITSVEPQKKDKTRCSVFVDGRFYCGIKLEVAVKHHLKAGMTITREELDKIQLDTEKAEAVDKAVTHLSTTPKTEREMRTFLAKKGYVDAVIDYVMEKLHYYNFVDDGAYCRAYLSSKTNKSKRAIEADLIKRGVDRRIIEEELKGYRDDGEQISALLKKYMRGKENTHENLYKACRYLVAKGYSYDDVKEACAGLEDEDN